jgi:hypothetical protein
MEEMKAMTHGIWHQKQATPKPAKLLPFKGEDYVTIEVMRLNKISQIFETHLSGGIDRNTSSELKAILKFNQHLLHICQIRLYSKTTQRDTLP